MDQSNLEKDIKFLVYKYIAGYANAEESVEIDSWLNASSSNKRYFDEMNDIWQSISMIKEGDEFDELAAWKKFQTKIYAYQSIDEKKRKETHSGSKRHSALLLGKYWRIAASVLILVSISLNGVLILRKNKVEQGITEMLCPIGSKTQIALPDGTQVWLNAGSRITYNANFNQKNRKVYLEGEGFFDVAKNQKKPFIVQTSDIDILVTGTKFNLKSYPEEKSIETTLLQGEIIINIKSVKQSTPTKLLPNQKAIFIKEKGSLALSDIDLNFITEDIKLETRKIFVSDNVDMEIDTGWKDHKLVFRNESLQSMLIKIERWYGVKIILTDKEIKEYHFNGTIEDETIHEVMNILSLTLPINFTIDHKTITINKTRQ